MHASTRQSLAEALNALISDVQRNSGTSAARVLEGVGVTAAQFRTLVGVAGGATTVSSVAVRMDVTQPTASRLVAALAAKGFVAASVSAFDRRAKELTLTADGRAFLRRIDAARVRDLRVYVERLTADQAARLAEALSAFADEAAA